jgi:PEGA domain
MWCQACRASSTETHSVSLDDNGVPKSKWSRCVPLQKGVSFDAKQEKHGVTVYYVDEEGKARKQLYARVGPDADNPARTPAAAAVRESEAPVANKDGAPAPAAVTDGSRETVKCSVSSNPSGAEITLDGRYVGSTPSILSVGVGSHVVQVSLPGYVQWKRDLTVSPGSELTVNAVLEKAQ